MLAIAQALLAHGARVTLRRARRGGPGARRRGAGLGAVAGETFDITDRAAVAAAFERARSTLRRASTSWSTTPARPISAPFLKTDAEFWQRMLGVNLTGAYLLHPAALPDMLRGGMGPHRQRGHHRGPDRLPLRLGLLRRQARRRRADARAGAGGRAKGITVNAVCPGYTETDIVREAVANIVAKTGRSEDEARAELRARNPQGRLVQPRRSRERGAPGCACPAADAMNGQAIAVAGGEVM